MALGNTILRALITLPLILMFTPCRADEAKPWSRWWWMGSAVTAEQLTATMETYANADIGGLEITPIYGVRGMEDRFVGVGPQKWTVG